MKELKLEMEKRTIKYSFPTNLKEITKEHLLDVTKHVVVAPNYSLVALAHHAPLKLIILNYKKDKGSLSTGVVPLFVKTGDTDSSFINSLKTGDKLNISSSDLQLGHHVVTPTVLNIDTICRNVNRYITQEQYNDIFVNNSDYEIYFIDFKLIPNCDIHAGYKEINIDDCNSNDNFMIVMNDEVN